MNKSSKSTKGTPLTRERAIEILEKAGIGMLPEDHPFYSEPATIRFVNHRRKRKPDQENED